MIGVNQILFGNKGTYTDFGLLMTGRSIGAPSPKKKQIKIPFRDGVLDYTQYSGRTFYDNREIEFDFKLIDPDRFYLVYSALAEYLHGQYMQITIPEDPSYYYYGMCELSELEVSKALGKITISIDAEPYKYSKSSPQDEIKWDDVNFETTIFRYVGTLAVTDSYQLVIEKGGSPVVPVFTVSNISSNTFTVRSSRNSKTYTLVSGKNRFPDLTVCGTTNVTLTFTGSATVKVDYKESRL